MLTRARLEEMREMINADKLRAPMGAVAITGAEGLLLISEVIALQDALAYRVRLCGRRESTGDRCGTCVADDTLLPPDMETCR